MSSMFDQMPSGKLQQSGQLLTPPASATSSDAMVRVNHLDLTSAVYVAVRHLFRRLTTIAISERLKSNRVRGDWEGTRKRAIKSPVGIIRR